MGSGRVVDVVFDFVWVHFADADRALVGALVGEFADVAASHFLLVWERRSD